MYIKHRMEAYADRPFKQGYVHISAPHMYATVLEQLELQPGHSFLNIGSGSGYFSCLVACMLGEGGLSHGIDINEDVVKHSQGEYIEPPLSDTTFTHSI